MHKDIFFPGWSSSYLTLACAHLVAGRSGPVADFSGLKVVVPTAEAGRQLREEMATRFDAVLSLQVVLPEFLLPVAENVATDAQVMAAWLKSLRRGEHIMSELYRSPGNMRDDYFLLGAASKIQELRSDFAAVGMTLRDALARLDSENDCGGELYFDQRDRLRALIALEDIYLKSNPDILDPVEAYLAAISHGGITGRVVIAGCLELKDSVIKCLEASNAEVEILVFAPATHAGDFDDWGRPLPQSWLTYDMSCDLDNVRRLKDQSAQARRLAGIVKHGVETDSAPSVIGVIDPIIGESLQDIRANDPTLPEFFQPGNDTLASQPLVRLFCAILELRHSVSFTHVAELARNIFVQRFAGIDDVSGFLTTLDRCQKKHLITDFGALRRVMENDFTDLLLTWNNRLAHAQKPLSEGWEIFASLLTAGADEIDISYHAPALTALRNLVAECEFATAGMASGCSIIMLRQLLSSARFGRDSRGGEVELLGFLELAWRKEDELIIAGMNEQAFNYGTGRGIFLPDAMRARLGMPTAKNAFAADIVRFASLQASKRLKIFYGKSSGDGDGLRPSRLLLMCRQEALAERAALFFGGSIDEDTPLLEPHYPPFLPYMKNPGNTISVTGFATYIECPFKYYRERVCGADDLHDRNQELDAAGYGNAVHEVLNRLMERFPTQTDVDVMADQATKLLDRYFDGLNEKNNGILSVQKQLILDSLKAFCAIQYENSDGWRVEEMERKHELGWGELFHFMFPTVGREEWRNEVTLVGKIDRVDVREVRGVREIRVLDYKTGRADPPAKKHLSKIKLSSDDRVAAMEVEMLSTKDIVKAGGRGEKYWSDLQLPMYVLIQKYLAGDPEAEVTAGYFNLPVNCSESALNMFAELANPGVLEHAVRAADFIMRSIFVDNRFWPPKRFDDTFDAVVKKLGGCAECDFLPQERWRGRDK